MLQCPNVTDLNLHYLPLPSIVLLKSLQPILPRLRILRYPPPDIVQAILPECTQLRELFTSSRSCFNDPIVHMILLTGGLTQFECMTYVPDLRQQQPGTADTTVRVMTSAFLRAAAERKRSGAAQPIGRLAHGGRGVIAVRRTTPVATVSSHAAARS
jgi:hypothetical protein